MRVVLCSSCHEAIGGPVYLFAYPYNITGWQNYSFDSPIGEIKLININAKATYLLILYQGLQVCIILLMDKYGSRFFVPSFVKFRNNF